MKWNLSEIGIEKDLLYECITTTISKEGVKNAGAFHLSIWEMTKCTAIF